MYIRLLVSCMTLTYDGSLRLRCYGNLSRQNKRIFSEQILFVNMYIVIVNPKLWKQILKSILQVIIKLFSLYRYQNKIYFRQICKNVKIRKN